MPIKSPTELVEMIKAELLEKMAMYDIPTRKDRTGPWYKDSGDRVFDRTTHETVIGVVAEMMSEKIFDPTSPEKEMLSSAKSQISVIFHEYGKDLVKYIDEESHKIRHAQKNHSIIPYTSKTFSLNRTHTSKVFDDSNSDIAGLIANQVRKDISNNKTVIGKIANSIEHLHKLTAQASEVSSRSSSQGRSPSETSIASNNSDTGKPSSFADRLQRQRANSPDHAREK